MELGDVCDFIFFGDSSSVGIKPRTPDLWGQIFDARHIVRRNLIKSKYTRSWTISTEYPWNLYPKR